MQNIVAKSVAVESLFVNAIPIFGDNTAIVRAVTASNTNTIKSGAIALPAHALITKLSIVVTKELTTSSNSSTLGHRVGTADDGETIATTNAGSLVDINHAGSTAVVGGAGGGTSTDVATQVALGGYTPIVFASDAVYATAPRSIHMQVDSSDGNITDGACHFIVEFTQLLE